jgi:zinc protease
MKRTPALLALLLATALPMVGAAEIEGLPPIAAARDAKVAEVHEKTLANGLRVIVVERPGLPLVSAEVLLRSGAEADPARLAGLAGFTASLLTQGTETRSATQIAREIEALGGAIKAESSWDGTSVALGTLSAQVEPAMALLADVTKNPKFAPEEIERQRRQAIDELKLSMEEPGTVAKLAASRVVLGSSPYAHPASGTVASIQRLKRADIVALHRAYYTAGQAQLIIAGNITAEEGFAFAEKNFGDWKSAPEQSVPTPTAPGVPSPRFVLIDMPNAGQAAVIVAMPGIARSADDYFAGRVTNATLGGGYTSRLNQEIRVKRGLSYGAVSTLTTFRAGGWITARCQTKNASAAEVVQLMQAELKRLGAEEVPPEFLASRQATLSGDFARELETGSGYVGEIAHLTQYGLPVGDLASYAGRVRAVTPAEVRAFSDKHLVPAAASVIVAGKASEIAAPLRKIFPNLEVIPVAQLDLESPTLRRAKH